MKLIIDIPEEVYNYIMRLNLCNMAEEYIKNGTPLDNMLDKIRAEILNFKGKCNASDYLGCGILEIIDKYKAESEN